MENWEKQRIEYRPPSPPRRELEGKGTEIADHQRKSDLSTLPLVLNESLEHYPADTLEVLEDTEKQLDTLISSLSACLTGDERDGVMFSTYETGKKSDERYLEPSIRNDMRSYESSHALSPDGKLQVEALSAAYDMKKEVSFYKDLLKQAIGVTEQDTVDSLKQKQIEKRTLLIDKAIKGDINPEIHPDVKQIAHETKFSFLMKRRSQTISTNTDRITEVLTYGPNELLGGSAETAVFELGKAGKAVVEQLKNVQEKSFEGTAYRLISSRTVLQTQSGRDMYEPIAKGVFTAQAEIAKTEPLLQWLEGVDEEVLEFHHPLGVMIDTAMQSIEIGLDGMNELWTDWEKFNRNSTHAEDKYLDGFLEKAQSKSAIQVLDIMLQHYDFDKNSPEEAKKFVAKHQLNKPKSICS